MTVNVPNRTIFWHDNLGVLQGINSACVDLVYLDPPFNKNKKFVAPLQSSARGAGFDDIFRRGDVKDEWLLTIKEDWWQLHNLLEAVRCTERMERNYNYCYLTYMAMRLLEVRRVLKETGAVYLHCDMKMSHYLKLIMDCVFGEANFLNEIVWCYTGPGNVKRYYPRKHDTILYYVKNARADYVFNADAVRIPYRKLHTGNTSGIFNAAATLDARGKIPESWWEERRDKMSPVGRLRNQNEKYPTQKPLALLERIILASSREGDWVLDPFCGCATTCIAAERLGRKWMGIDTRCQVYELIKARAEKEIRVNLWDSAWVNFERDAPARCDGGGGGGGEEKDVYVFSHARAFPNAFKVGVAKDWRQRLGNYQTGDPQRGYRYAFHVRTARYRELERFVHQEFNAHGEWVIGVGLEAIEKAIALKLAE